LEACENDIIGVRETARMQSTSIVAGVIIVKSEYKIMIVNINILFIFKNSISI
ncbi:14214_t:CDS:2, partial [Gigaspora margarita]